VQWAFPNKPAALSSAIIRARGSQFPNPADLDLRARPLVRPLLRQSVAGSSFPRLSHWCSRFVAVNLVTPRATSPEARILVDGARKTLFLRPSGEAQMRSATSLDAEAVHQPGPASCKSRDLRAARSSGRTSLPTGPEFDPVLMGVSPV